MATDEPGIRILASKLHEPGIIVADNGKILKR
jgi:hypothetical protein